MYVRRIKVMSNVWIFHHNDGDGYASAVVIASDFCHNHNDSISMDKNVHLISINFNKSIDFSQIRENDTVYVLDYTPNREDDILALNELWNKYENRINYIHIDHHKTALNIVEKCEGLKNYLKIQGGIFL